MAKQKKLNRKALEELANSLPKKDRSAFLKQDITKEWLEEQIKYRKELIKRDLWIGIPWFITYGASLYFAGMTPATIAIFVIGMVYFLYTIFTTGSYGDNRVRVKVYELLLKQFK